MTEFNQNNDTENISEPPFSSSTTSPQNSSATATSNPPFASFGPAYGQVPPFGQAPPYGPFPFCAGGTPYQPPRRPSFFVSMFKKCFAFFFALIFSAGIFFFMLICMIGGLVGVFATLEESNMGVTEKTLAGTAMLPKKVAILPIEGLIEGKENGFIRKAIKQASADPKLVAIVLRVNSPGGTISGSDYYYYLLKELKKERDIPIVVSMGALATSGGYYVSMVGNKIYAERSTMTGSIGVIIPLYNAARMCDKIGISSNAIVSGPMKTMGDFTREMGPEEKKIWQSLVDSGYQQFLSVVREGRPQFQKQSGTDVKSESAELKKSMSGSEKSGAEKNKVLAAKKEETSKKIGKNVPELETIADGRIYTASQAKELGLIDEIGFVDNAVRNAIELSGQDESQVQVVRYESEPSFADLLQGAEEGVRSNLFSDPVDTVSKSLTPEAYYLAPRTFPIRK